MEIYDEMAEHYDLIYGDLTDVEFYLVEARNARGSVLEVGCGTGRILLRLLEEGIDAYGIDSSGKMLAILKRDAEAKGLEARVFEADMLDFSLERKFQLIILPYRTFMHLRDSGERKKALLTFRKHLEQGGRLILHLYNPSEDDLKMTGGFHHFESEDITSPDGVGCHIDWHLNYEPQKRVAHYKVVLTLEGGKSFTYPMDIYFTPMKEMGELLKGCGYRNVRSYCGFEYLPFSEECSEVLWVAEA